MPKKFILILPMVIFTIQGCQKKLPDEPLTDDWIVGTWAPENNCTNENIHELRPDGVFVAAAAGGAWRLKNSILTVTYLYAYNDAGGSDILFEDNQVRYKILTHDKNRSMVTLDFDNPTKKINWSRCEDNQLFENKENIKSDFEVESNSNSNNNYDINKSIYDGKNFCGITTKKIWSLHDNTAGDRAKGVPAGTRLKIEACEKDTEACYTADGEAYFADGIKKVPCN